jgi:dolichol-phosphate mannosyltransferase
MSDMLDELLVNTEDAYTFPPFAWIAKELQFEGLDVSRLRDRERDLLRVALGAARRFRLRVTGHEWSTVIPGLLESDGAREGGLTLTGSTEVSQSAVR